MSLSDNEKAEVLDHQIARKQRKLCSRLSSECLLVKVSFCVECRAQKNEQLISRYGLATVAQYVQQKTSK